MIPPLFRGALAPLAVTAVLTAAAIWLWPETGSPTVDRARDLCRQQVMQRLNDTSATFADIRSTRAGDAIEVTGAAIGYTPVRRYEWTCTAHGRYATVVRVDGVQVTGTG